MPLQLPTPPSNFYVIVAQALSRVSATGGTADSVTNVQDPSRLNAALPHKVYALGNDDIIRGSNLNKAQLVGWRVLIQYGPQTVAAMELTSDFRGENVRFASLDTGPFAQRTRQLVGSVETFDVVQRGLFELRMLRAPSVYVVALWLKDLRGSGDIVVPMGTPQEAQTGGATVPQTTTDFVKGLSGPAETARRFDGRPQPGGGARPPGGSGPPAQRSN